MIIVTKIQKQNKRKKKKNQMQNKMKKEKTLSDVLEMIGELENFDKEIAQEISTIGIEELYAEGLSLGSKMIEVGVLRQEIFGLFALAKYIKNLNGVIEFLIALSAGVCCAVAYISRKTGRQIKKRKSIRELEKAVNLDAVLLVAVGIVKSGLNDGRSMKELARIGAELAWLAVLLQRSLETKKS